VTTQRLWPWEGAVQAVFVEFLGSKGWRVDAVADTATKERGVDILATKHGRTLGAEVKGWPSSNYADPRRAYETKRPSRRRRPGIGFRRP
jgi:hypothetical protein